MEKSDLKTIGSTVTLGLTIAGSVFGAADYVGSKIYSFAQAQTASVQNIREVQKQYQNDIVPRIIKLESLTAAAATEAAAAKQRVSDMAETLTELKNLATANLAVSRSHTEDIKATRDQVAPKMAPGSR